MEITLKINDLSKEGIQEAKDKLRDAIFRGLGVFGSLAHSKILEKLDGENGPAKQSGDLASSIAWARTHPNTLVISSISKYAAAVEETNPFFYDTILNLIPELEGIIKKEIEGISSNA